MFRRLIAGSAAVTTLIALPLLSNRIAPLKCDSTPPMRNTMPEYLKDLQRRIVRDLERLEGPDGKRFILDSWKRTEGGEGISCVLQDGLVFEKAGVNVSVVHGPLPPAMEKQMSICLVNDCLGARKIEGLGEGPFRMFATGLSLVIHPHNPNAPTAHANYRYFELRDANGDKVDAGILKRLFVT
jgi:coproporphyrinogen III oxidase